MELLEHYSKDNCKRLKNISDIIIMKYFGWLPQKEYDDFYSIAGEVLWHCCENYDKNKGAQFETYLINCIIRKFKTRVTYMNRQRRNCGSQDVSLDALIEERDTSLINLIAVNNKEDSDVYSEKMTKYLGRLSKQQKRVLFAMSEGYSNEEIKRILKLTSKDFSDICDALKSYRNVSVLY